MKQLLIGVVSTIIIGTGSAFFLLASGAISFAADEAHGDKVATMIAWARELSVAKRAAAVSVPGDLTDKERLRRGAGNYDAMCVSCHLAPGQSASELSRGLYPAPPNLSKASAEAVTEMQDKRRFWIIKHGIKGSGMPAWAKADVDDQTIWDMVALIRHLPTLSAEEYRRTVELSDGHNHGQRENLDTAPAATGHHHKPGTKPHDHKH
jgi:mono/diheme cytochrome c family protein